MIPIFIKSVFILFVLLAFYKVILEKESFFMINRIYLLTCLLLVFILPFISLPQMMDNQGFVSKMIGLDNLHATNESQLFLFSDAPIGSEPSSTSLELKNNDNKANRKYGVGFWILAVYYFGVIILGLTLLAQIISTLYKAYINEDKIIDEDHIIINLTKDVEPCSFFKYIFINPSKYDYDTYEQILAHEKIHVNRKHSFDLILAEIVAIIIWFNPFAWLVRNEIIKNIEFETDNLLLSNKPDEKDAYQMNLIKIASHTKPLAITTNYNQSLIKKRILKMNTKKSNPYSLWKYTFIVPLIFVLVLGLNIPQSLSHHYS